MADDKTQVISNRPRRLQTSPTVLTFSYDESLQVKCQNSVNMFAHAGTAELTIRIRKLEAAAVPLTLR